MLDLFAGSGAVGFEAVSRGAASAVLVESDARGIRRTLDRLGDDAVAVRLIAGDAADAVEQLAGNGELFDVVFADPPYRLEPAAAGLARAGCSRPRGCSCSSATTTRTRVRCPG